MYSQDKPLTAKDLAEHLHLSERSIREHAANGRFPGAFKTPGSHWRFPKSVIEGRADGNDLPSANQDSQDTREAITQDTPTPIPHPSGSPLALHVGKPKVAQTRRPFSVGIRTLAAAVEATATVFVEGLDFALIMGDMPISEQHEPGESRRDLLGKATWHPVFRIPEGVSSGTHRVRIGAVHQGTEYLLGFDSSRPPVPRLIESDSFEVRVPRLRTLTAAEEALIAAEKAAKEARQRWNRVHHTMAVGAGGGRWEIDDEESEKATETLTAAERALEEARQRVIREDGTLDLGSYAH